MRIARTIADPDAAPNIRRAYTPNIRRAKIAEALSFRGISPERR